MVPFANLGVQACLPQFGDFRLAGLYSKVRANEDPGTSDCPGNYLLGFRPDSKELGCLMHPGKRKKYLSKHGMQERP